MGTKSTIRLLALMLAATACFAQTLPDTRTTSPAWRRLGNSSVGLNLAGPAGGRVRQVWFSSAGDQLFALLANGQVFETSDYSLWTLSRNATPPAEPAALPIAGADRNARVILTGGRLYSLGANLEVSEDNGRTWINLTGYNDVSIIGGAQRSVAISPLDPRQIVVANDFGVWRSVDGGLSWAGLNEDLPNLPIRKVYLSGRSLLAEMDGLGRVELPPAAAASHANWIRSEQSSAEDLRLLLARNKLAPAVSPTAAALTLTTWFAGTADGRIWTSTDAGSNWTLSNRALGQIEAIEVADSLPHAAIAVVAAPGGPRVLRTINDGVFWDDISLNLPDGAIHGVAFDASTGAIYLASDRGVFAGRVDLASLAPVSPWQRIAGLPDARALDIRWDRSRNLLYVAIEGYGVYAAPAPHRSTAIRVLNAADQPAQAAAPGILLNVAGDGVTSVRSDSGDLPVVSSTGASTQVQVPFEITGSSFGLSIGSASGPNRVGLALKSASPSILVDTEGFPILVDSATGLTLDGSNIARPGSRIQIFAAGLGRVIPEWRAGIPAPDDPPAVIARVDARLDGTPVEVLRATLAPGYVGLYLVELQIPGLVNTGAAELSLTVDGETSNRVRIVLGNQN